MPTNILYQYHINAIVRKVRYMRNFHSSILKINSPQNINLTPQIMSFSGVETFSFLLSK